MNEPLDLRTLRVAANVYEIAHECGNCVSSDPTKVRTEKLRLIGEAIKLYATTNVIDLRDG